MAQPNSISLKNFYNQTIKQSAPYLTHQFMVRFIIPNGSSSSSAPDFIKMDEKGNSLPFYVQSSSVPQLQIKSVPVAFLSQDFVVPAVTQHGGTWNVTMFLTNDLKQYNAMYLWQQQYADLEFSGGSQPGFSKAIPDINAEVTLLDSTHQKSIADFTLFGVFPTGIPTIDFKYENASSVKSVQFGLTFQYMEDNLGNSEAAFGKQISGYKRTRNNCISNKFKSNLSYISYIMFIQQ